ncbi:MAG: S-layer homology domain-containing protein [Patescibacteria group bacterium]|nr:S-layer homology domain-containing protein [Patescibacteria group bacterium]
MTKILTGAVTAIFMAVTLAPTAFALPVDKGNFPKVKANALIDFNNVEPLIDDSLIDALNAVDISVTEVGMIDISGGKAKFYAEVCIEGKDIDTLTVHYDANGVGSTSVYSSDLPNENCQTYYSWNYKYYNLEPGETVDLAVTVDYYDYESETNESNNTLSTTVKIPEDPSTGDPFETDLFFDENDSLGITADYKKLYANVCGIDTSSLLGTTVDIEFNVNGQIAVETISIPDSYTCDKAYVNIADNFNLNHDTLYTVTATIDPTDQINEVQEVLNNVATTVFSVPSPVFDLVLTDMGILGDYNYFYATVYGVGTDGTESVELKFETNGQSYSTTVKAPANGEFQTYYSVNTAYYNLQEATTYTVTASIDSTNLLPETDEDNNTGIYTFTTLDPEPIPVNDDFLFRPSLVLLQIGDIDGPDALEDVISTYTGSFGTKDAGLVQVELVGPILFEEVTDNDAYTETTDGISFEVSTYRHWDGFVFYIYPTSINTTSVRSLELKIDGYLDEAITQVSDLKPYNIADGSGHKVELQLLTYLDTFGEEKAAAMVSNAEELIKSTQDTDLLTEVLSNAATLASENTTETVKSLTVETFEAEKAALAEMLYEEGINPFKDVSFDKTCWYCEYVSDMKNNGIISGYKDANGNATGEFKPGNQITAAELIKIAVKISGGAESQIAPLLDQAKDHWSKGFVATAEELGFNLVSESSLNLNRPATRAEVVEAMLQALGSNIPQYDSSSSYFLDVNSSHESFNYIQYAYDLGLISGDDNSATFRPDEAINRAEVSKIAARAMEL